IWQTYNLREAEFLFNKSNDAWINFLEESSDDGMQRRKKYKNSEGLDFRNTVLEITQHVINHSNYHRAGINSLLKQNDCAPAKTDYILYVRAI
ncbi:MAG: hypothetical protein K9I99_17495, partial [Melioribacteraceae bacterium]|nr:hypothetical protein [Melioribacteraceae bacterium]